MSNRARLFDFQGREIYFVNLTDISNTSEFFDVMEETGAFRESLVLAGKKNLLMLVDINNSILNLKILEKLKTNAKLTNKLTKREALVGLKAGAIYVHFLNMFTGMDFNIFTCKDKAMNWLIEE